MCISREPLITQCVCGKRPQDRGSGPADEFKRLKNFAGTSLEIGLSCRKLILFFNRARRAFL
jgi:hypothetical protein